MCIRDRCVDCRTIDYVRLMKSELGPVDIYYTVPRETEPAAWSAYCFELVETKYTWISIIPTFTRLEC